MQRCRMLVLFGTYCTNLEPLSPVWLNRHSAWNNTSSFQKLIESRKASQKRRQKRTWIFSRRRTLNSRNACSYLLNSTRRWALTHPTPPPVVFFPHLVAPLYLIYPAAVGQSHMLDCVTSGGFISIDSFIDVGDGMCITEGKGFIRAVRGNISSSLHHHFCHLIHQFGSSQLVCWLFSA